MEHREAYLRAQERVVALLDDPVADVAVPTCPGWTVKDLVAHLAGFFTTYKSGKGQDAFGPGWAEREVAARKDRSLEQLTEEWRAQARDPGDLFESRLGAVAVADVLAHEQDIRTALDRPGGRDDENIVVAIDLALGFLDHAAREEDLPALRIITEDLERQIGDGAPVATLKTSTFELFRTLHGRRTIEQVRDLEWEGEPGAWVERLHIFGPTEERVEG